MADIVSDLGVNLLEEEIDEVIFQTNQFLTDATFTGSQRPCSRSSSRPGWPTR